MKIEQAIEVFARGFSFTRSFTYPAAGEPLETGIWTIRDMPRVRGDYRGEEYIGFGVTADRIDAVARQQTRGRYSIWILNTVGEDDGALRADFKAMGYRLITTEAMMVNDLANLETRGIAEAPKPVEVVRVTTTDAANALAKAARRRQILPEDLQGDPPRQRQYMAVVGADPIGWVASIVVGQYTWCSNMYVAPEYRRRGIARALLCQMLSDDRAAGSVTNVLLASHLGAKLYPAVGYLQLGTLYGFMPRKAAPV